MSFAGHSNTGFEWKQDFKGPGVDAVKFAQLATTVVKVNAMQTNAGGRLTVAIDGQPAYDELIEGNAEFYFSGSAIALTKRMATEYSFQAEAEVESATTTVNGKTQAEPVNCDTNCECCAPIYPGLQVVCDGTEYGDCNYYAGCVHACNNN